MKRFVVEHHTALGGWVNCWTDEENGVAIPVTFGTYDETMADLVQSVPRTERDQYRITEII